MGWRLETERLGTYRTLIMRVTYFDRSLIIMLRGLATIVAKQFKIKGYKQLFLFSTTDPYRHCYGINANGKIWMRLRRRGKTRKFLPLESLLDTVVHEIAHCVHHKHNREFWALHKKMKSWATKTLF